MVQRFAITFEDDPLEDVVTFAVTPIDSLTGRIVPRNITAIVTASNDEFKSEDTLLPDKPVRNLTGMLVFINLPIFKKYRVSLSANNAGYFNPDPVVFTPPSSDEDFIPRDRLSIDIQLFPLPSFDFLDETTLISGVVVMDKEKVNGARVSLEFIPPAIAVRNNNGLIKAFETRTDERGAFALAVRIPLVLIEEVQNRENKSVAKAKFRIETKSNNSGWELQLEWEIKIKNGRQIFKFPINLLNKENQVELTT